MTGKRKSLNGKPGWKIETAGRLLVDEVSDPFADLYQALGQGPKPRKKKNFPRKKASVKQAG